MQPLIITGMHRSGTSAVARMVQGLGFDLGRNLLSASENNRHGHFEETGFIAFHDRLITRLFPDRAPFCEWLPLSGSEAPYAEADYAEARALWKAHRAAGGIAWKDPRTSLFLDLWLNVLPEAKVIICLRHPYQVHLSLLRRGEPFLHADYSAGLRGWVVYSECIRRELDRLAPDRFLVVDVDGAFRDSAALAQTLAHFLDVAAPEGAAASITPEDFHFEEELPWALETFAAYFPEIDALHRGLRAPGGDPPATAPALHPVRSDEARLIEFEEACGLRRKARTMLVHSIEADRGRYAEFHRLSVQAHEEKDKLIADLARLNDLLKVEMLRRGAADA